MGCGSHILHMIFIIIIIIFMFISFKSTTHILAVDASLNAAAEYFNGHGLQELHYLEDHIEKVTGEDEGEEKQALIIEKFRALLGLKSITTKTPSNGEIENGWSSPSPSPSATIEAEAPAPALPPPPPPIHVHTHHPMHPIPPPHKTHKEDHKGKLKRILLAVLVSVGATFVLCTIGLIWVRKRSANSAVSTTHNTEGGARGGSMYVSSQNSVKKVSSEPLGLDLFYLNTIETALESQAFCLKQNSENTPSCELHERGESEQEIVCVHDESAESVKCESDGSSPNFSSSGDHKVVPADQEAHSSDDESFHSFCDSHSSNMRLSNASEGSLCDNTSEILSPKGSKTSPCSVTSPEPLQPLPPPPPSPPFLLSPRNSNSSSGSNQTPQSDLSLSPPNLPRPSGTVPPLYLPFTSANPATNCQKGFTPPPPPPPPLPSSSNSHISPSHSSSCLIRIICKDLSSPTLPFLSSPRNSNRIIEVRPMVGSQTRTALVQSKVGLETSSLPNQTPQSDLPPSLSPPNPPKPPGTIPPPPCPPPFFKGHSNSLKGPPPPPPSQLSLFTPLGKDGAPLPKLKPLHWDKVRATPDRSMVWDKLKSSSFELDEEMIESLFGYNLQNSTKNDEAKSKSPSPSKHVLEHKRLQNITILAKALNVTAEQVCDALVQGEGLCLQQLEALVKMVPTKEEEAKLSSYKGDINGLCSAEKFVKAMLNIPFAFLRIEAMLYRATFEDEVVHLRKSFSMLEEACKELRSSQLFLKLLEAVLKTGNRMNVGTIRGGAKAFKLDALLKLSDVKGTDGRTTLLHFVVQEIVRSEGIRVSESIMGKINQKSKSQDVEEREEHYRRMGLDLVSSLSNELCNVKKTATIDLDVLASSVSNLSNGMAKLQCLVGKDLCQDEKSGNFVNSMRSFLGYAEKNIKELQEGEGRVLLLVREITEYFHGDVSKDEVNPLRIFVIVRDFLGMLDHVCKELRSSKGPSSPNPLAPFR